MKVQDLLAKRLEKINDLDKLQESSEVLDAEQTKQFDALAKEIATLDESIERAKSVEALKASVAADAAKAVDDADMEQSRSKVQVTVKEEKLEKGIGFSRMARAKFLSQQAGCTPAQMATKLYGSDNQITKALEAGTANAAAELVQEGYANEIIELLRASTVINNIGARMLTLDKGNLTLPRHTATVTATWPGENAAVNATDLATDEITLSLKKITAMTSVTSELLADTSYGVDALIRDDIVQSIANTKDLQLLRGTGGANLPTSLLEIATNESNATAALGGAAPTLAQVRSTLSGLILTPKSSNISLANGCYIISPRTEHFLRYQLSDGNGNLVFAEEMAQGRLMGFKYLVTTAIPENLGAGTDESEIYFVAGSSVLLAEGAGIDVDMSTTAAIQVGGSLVSAYANDLTAVRAKHRCDLATRHVNAVAVANAVQWA